MNDDELDEMLRGIPTPGVPQEPAQRKKAPVGELVAFSLLAVALLGWALGALCRIFGT